MTGEAGPVPPEENSLRQLTCAVLAELELQTR